MLYWSSRDVQKCSYSKYSLFTHPFRQKMSTYLVRAKKKVKSLKIERFDQTAEKRTPPNSGQFWPVPSVSAIQSFNCIKYFNSLDFVTFTIFLKNLIKCRTKKKF